MKAIQNVPPDNRPSHLVELGEGVVWAWTEEITQLADPS